MGWVPIPPFLFEEEKGSDLYFLCLFVGEKGSDLYFLHFPACSFVLRLLFAVPLAYAILEWSALRPSP